MKDRQTKPIATDRSMQPDDKKGQEGQLFFFPRRNPPVSVRAATREEAEKLLDDDNHTDA